PLRIHWSGIAVTPRVRNHIRGRCARRSATGALVAAVHRFMPVQELSAMHVRPLHDRILVQRLEEGEQQVGGIIIPDSAKEKPQRGTVVAAGRGKVNDEGERVALDVRAGDTILFGKYSGQEIKLDGVEYL